MLVLTRKLQQQIKIGEQITVTILKVKGQTVRVGIEAPRDVRVLRGELPPEGENEGEPETQIIEAVIRLETDENGGVTAEEITAPSITTPGLRGDLSDEADERVPRLPQRRLYNRYGVAPLRLAGIPQAALAE